jgi:hypothetical protein
MREGSIPIVYRFNIATPLERMKKRAASEGCSFMSYDSTSGDQYLTRFASGIGLLPGIYTSTGRKLILLRIVRKTSVGYLLRGPRPSGASHKRYPTLISRSLLTDHAMLSNKSKSVAIQRVSRPPVRTGGRYQMTFLLLRSTQR